ncbi:malate dehydrogenase [Sulfodiicoccus acidiphilus]|uniref:Malate dehydrogenase n=1 Tax=Sulfodiicoccus acidiphilus TaxID=1670455 RepID=A0A348B463_9CREN|nr:lactate/malate dehydrogenase family protein [Sulfodiicoccus acidiphilus]BBD72965.1 malate dehydrogenase [Sulfodiicoccus acidiphilus]GGT87666.1 malate dehydrogenase [Sulfodiicoccus acidiphilus]
MAKIAFIGVGKIGQTIAYSIIMDGLASEAMIYDVIPELPDKFEHELRHALATRGLNTEILSSNNIQDVNGADVVVITAGKPRKPGMSRRDLFVDNAKIMMGLAKDLVPRNPGAKYVMVTNPVDMMASVFMNYSKAFTISTGDQVETMRMRSFIAKKLKTPVTKVNGFVGGEHGEDAVVLWSTVSVDGKPFDQLGLKREEVDQYVKGIAAEIIRVMGGTTWGPATIIKDVVRSIVLNENRVMSIATPHKVDNDYIHIAVPTVVGNVIGPSIEGTLPEEEKEKLNQALRDVHRVYKENMAQLVGTT